jgi:hypothetical protein
MITIPIKTATNTDTHQTIAALILSFSTNPIARWYYPDPHQYLVHCPEFFKAFAGKAFKQQTAYYVDGFFAAALWLSPGIQPDEETMVSLLQRTVSNPLQEEAFGLIEQMGSYHPTEPHWYLPLIGVDQSNNMRASAQPL